MTDHEEAQAAENKEAQESGGGSSASEPAGPKVVSGWVMFFLGLIGAWVVSMIIYWGPNPLYAKKIQPFDFNHYAHSEDAGMDCDECHKFGDDGRFSGAPSFQDCLECHTWADRQNEDNAKETAFLEKFVDPDSDELIGDPKWYIYSGQPDCVYFSHIAHTEMGGMECQECHGDHGQSQSLEPFYENRLTGYSKLVYQKWKMTDCGDCHEDKGKPENNYCFVCHK